MLVESDCLATVLDMNKKVLHLCSIVVMVLLFSVENQSQRKDTLDPQSPNWNRLAREDIQALQLNTFFGRQLQSSEQEHMHWVAKVARFLRGGLALSKKDDLKALAKMTREEVVTFFTSQPVFYDAVLDFNLYFLGFRMGKLKNNGEYASELYNFGNALHSAISTARGGDYFSILNLYPPAVVLPFSNLDPSIIEQFPEYPDKEGFLKLSSLEQKLALIDHVQVIMKDLDAALKSNKKTVAEACNELNPIRFLYSYLGIHYNFVSKNQNHKDAEAEFGNKCYVDADLATTLDAPLQYAAAYEAWREVVKDFDKSNYKVFGLNDLKEVPLPGQEQSLVFRNGIFGQVLANSSTNFNRKRGAYILSKFFCDDLTPINVEMPETHTGGAHGSEPSCYACHYKLDPMAGFFRNHGLFFADYSKENTITFDDFATVNKDEYQKAWLADAQSGRQWNVGYVRSEKNDKLNSYGESLEDLFKIIRGSYEYKRCIVKRLFKFATDDTQVMDGGYIEGLSQTFDQESEVNSAKAIKDLFVKVALSKTFAQDDRNPQTCYDADPLSQSALPCAVRFVIEKNCTQCHDSTLSFSGLDMTTWSETTPGSFGFFHVDENGVVLDRTESITRIIDRLTTNDPKKRMPKKMHMDAAHREQLYLWLNQELQK